MRWAAATLYRAVEFVFVQILRARQLLLPFEEHGLPKPRHVLWGSRGLLAVRVPPTPERVVAAARVGAYCNEGNEWFIPRERAVFEIDAVRVNRRDRAKMRRRFGFGVTMDQEFGAVVRGCANRPDTWIRPQTRAAAEALASRGDMHSVEVLDATGRLVGGLYGLSVGRLFTIESMFSVEPAASKVAFFTLARHLEKWGYELIDVQEMSQHYRRWGAISISRDAYARKLERLRDLEPQSPTWTVNPTIPLVLDRSQHAESKP